jgi:hypothetical protein
MSVTDIREMLHEPTSDEVRHASPALLVQMHDQIEACHPGCGEMHSAACCERK